MRNFILIILFLTINTPVLSDILEYQFEGVIDNSTGGDAALSSIDSFMGHFIYNSDSQPFSYGNGMSVANYKINYFAVNFYGPEIILSYPNETFTRRRAQVRNIASESSDWINFRADDWIPNTIPSITRQFRIDMKDYDKTVFSGPAWLPESLNLSDFEHRSFTGFVGTWQFEGTITTLVPEPATVFLLGLGAVMLRKKR